MFKDFIATLVTTIIAVSGAVADTTGHLTEQLGDRLFPAATSISYARVPERPVPASTGTVRGESTSTPPTTVMTQPVIERVVETVRTVGTSGMSSADLDARLAVFAQDFTNRLQLRSDTSLRQDEIVSDSIGETLAGDLNGLTIAASSWTGGTIPDATITGGSLANYLPLTGGTLTGDLSLSGTLTAGSLSVAGVSSGGAIAAPYFTATSSTATSTFAGTVGIGTTSPSSYSRLHINRGSATANVVLDSNASNASSALEFARGGELEFSIYNYSGDGALRVWNYGLNADVLAVEEDGDINLTEAAFFSRSTGNVGIAQISPTYKLDVSGLGRFTGLVGLVYKRVPLQCPQSPRVYPLDLKTNLALFSPSNLIHSTVVYWRTPPRLRLRGAGLSRAKPARAVLALRASIPV